MKETKFWEFRTCIEYELEDGSHVFRCKGCNSEFDTSKHAGRHAQFCKQFKNEYKEDYSQFQNNIQKLYIDENQTKKEVCDILRIDTHFFDKIISELQIDKSESQKRSKKSEILKKSFMDKYGVDNPFRLDSVKEKIKQTNLEKYGVENPSQSEEVKAKVRETCMEHYGTSSHLQSKEIKERIRQTNIEKYGVPSAMQSEEVKEKSRKTSLERYGTLYPLQSEEVKETLRKSNLDKYRVENVSQVEEIKRKREETFLKNYGVTSPLKSEEIQEHIKNTNLERYGSENPFGSEEVQEKIKETNLKKYGVEYPMQSEMIQNKSKQTCMEHFDAYNPMQSDKIREQTKETCIERYGVEYPIQSDEIKRIREQRNLEKYGVKNPSQLEEVKAKIKQTCVEKYGFTTNLKSQETKDKIRETCLERYGVPYNCMTDQCISANGHIISKSNKAFAEYLKNEFDINSEFEFHIGHNSYDIHISDSDTLIEIDPTYTHNSTIGPKFANGHECSPMSFDYHLHKTQLAKENGYHCIHVFDWDSWTKIINIINPNKKKIYARNCQLIYDIPQKECNKFLNDYHLQGTCRGQSIRLGLYYDDKLVQVMTFGKPRYNKKYKWELLRYCSHPDYMITGGSQKLFKYFVKYFKPESVISYCDISKFNGNVYSHLGFKLHHSTGPTPHWFNGETHITDALLRQRGFDQLFKTNYGKGTSNEELMILHGFVKVYDCGQNVYIWKKKDN